MVFIYDVDIYNTQVLVGIGGGVERLRSFVLKKGSSEAKGMIKNVVFPSDGSYNGFCLRTEYRGVRYYMIYVNGLSGWSDYDVLLHEIVHLKQFIFEDKGIIDEREHEAYFVESVFRGIRRKFQKLD